MLDITNKGLLKVLNTYFFQKFIHIFFQLECVLWTFYSILLAFIMFWTHMFYFFDKYNFFIQQLVVTLMFVLLFWYRFRVSFLNIDNLLSVEDLNYLSSKEDSDWTDFIFAFNSFFSRNYEKLGLRKKTVYVTNRLGSGNGKEGMFHAILNGFKHHPGKTVGAGGAVLGGLLAREVLLHKQHTDTLASQDRQHTATLAVEREALESQDKQHTATLVAQQEEQTRNFLLKGLKGAEDGVKNANDFLDKASKSRDKELIAEAKSQLYAAKQHYHDLKLVQLNRVKEGSLSLKISREDMNQLKGAKQDSLDLKVEAVDLDFKPKCPFEPTLISDYLERKSLDISEFNSNIKADKSVLINGRNLTNIGIFRKFINTYIENHSAINKNMTIMVRQLSQTEHGVPLEIYAFSNDQRWENYEFIVSDVFDHIIASVSYFDLEVYELSNMS